MMLLNLRSFMVLPVAFAASQPAFADVTAEDVWSDIRELSSAMGQTVTAESETRSGDTLTVSGIAMTLAVEDGTVGWTIPEIILRERGDGTVEITTAEEFPLTVSVSPPGEDSVELTMLFRQSGMVTIASGDPENTNYDYTAPRIEVVMDQLIPDEPAMQMAMNIAVQNSTGSYRSSGDETKDMVSDFTADALIGAIKMQEQDGEGLVDMTFTMSELVSTSTAAMAPVTSFTNLAAMLESGFASDGDLRYGASTFAMSVISPEDSMTLNGGASRGYYEFDLGPDGLTYGGGNYDIAFSLSGSSIPFPLLNFAIGESSGRLTMPMSPTEEAADFGFVMKLVDLKVDDMIWSLFDPMQMIPRDPATLILDLTGKGRWTVDITDPAVAESLGENDVPGEIEAVTLNELRFSIAGAELTGGGAFSFDNTDLETFDGMPRPEGSLSLRLIGANALMDALVQMGFLPPDQVMGARMMLGLFARQVEGEDAYTSDIDVTGDGQVLANGQRLR